MSANELAALLGLAWSRLAIYPAGLAAFALIWLIAQLRPGPRAPARPSAPTPLGYSALASAWLGLALLPLPATAQLSRTADLLVVLALLEWPRLVAIAEARRAPDPATQAAGLRHLTAALNGYPSWILATLALALPGGTLEIATLARAPAAAAPAEVALAHWLGAGAWALALPAMLGAGPFRAEPIVGAARPRWGDPLWLGLWLRAIALVALAALPWVAPAGALEQPLTYDARLVATLIAAPLALAGALWGYDRATAGRPARPWARAYLALDAALLLALLWAAYAQLPRA